MATSLFLRFAILAVGALLLGAIPQATRISVADFGATPNSGKDATPAFQKAIEAVKKARGPVTLVVPPGRYDFFSLRATRRVCYYSNATEPGSDGMRTIAIDLSDVKDVTVDGPGARLVMRGQMTMLVAERAENLTLNGLEFDFARPTVSEIRAVDKGDGYWIGQVHADSKYRLKENRIEWYGEDWSGTHNLVQHYHPLFRVWRGDDPTAGATAIREEKEGRLRFEVPAQALDQVEVGRIYQFRDTTRKETGMWFNRSRNVTLNKIQIRAMAGFGVLFQFTENVNVNGIEVAPARGSGRTCAAAADILHFSGCRGQIQIQRSILSSAHDDAINIHGTHLRVMERLDERRIRVRFMHPQTWGFLAFAEKDEIEFVRKDTLLPFAKGVVKAVEAPNPHEQILTLEGDVPADLKLDSDAVENVTWTPSVTIAGCEISFVPTRGILVTTRQPVRIIGNTFLRTPMPAVLLEDDAAGWYESGAVHDLLIQGNQFVECANETIQVNPQNQVHAGPVHRNIRIEGNVFNQVGPIAVCAKSTDGLSVVANQFRWKRGTPEADFVRTRDTTNVRVQRNVVGAGRGDLER